VAISDQNLKDLIVATVGDLNGVVAANINTLWDKYARFGPVYPQLQALYAERDALRLLQGQVWQQVDKTVGPLRENLAERHRALSDRLKEMEAAILLAQRQAAAATGGAVAGQIATVEPVAPPFVGTPDATDPRYSGSPYVPPFTRAGSG
jgi:hypothetical protein